MKRIIFVFMFLMFSIHFNTWGFQKKDVIVAKQNGNEGISEAYPVTKDQAWEIALAALRWEKSNRVEEHYAENYMLTSFGIISCPCKTEAGIWIEPVDKDHTKVTIITKGRVQKNVLTDKETFPDVTGPDFHEWFQAGVEIIKRGEKLPFLPPKK